MDCATCEMMVDVYLDGEMSATDCAAFERALELCPECRRRLEDARALSGLLRELPAEPAPDLLRDRIERELRSIAGKSQPIAPAARPAAHDASVSPQPTARAPARPDEANGWPGARSATVEAT